MILPSMLLADVHHAVHDGAARKGRVQETRRLAAGHSTGLCGLFDSDQGTGPRTPAANQRGEMLGPLCLCLSTYIIGTLFFGLQSRQFVVIVMMTYNG